MIILVYTRNYTQVYIHTVSRATGALMKHRLYNPPEVLDKVIVFGAYCEKKSYFSTGWLKLYYPTIKQHQYFLSDRWLGLRGK